MNKNLTLKYSALFLVALITINMGGGGETSILPDPYHTELEDDQKVFVATLLQNGEGKKVKKINFAGKTTIENVKEEGQNPAISISRTIDLSTTKKLTIVDMAKDPKYVIVNQEKTDGSTVDNLLVPKNIIVSGIGLGTGIKGDRIYGRLHIFSAIEIHHGESGRAQEKDIIN
ncbi:hypothetical protein KAW80_02570 [Candidatus Babeliales bacterium]|nr:hypothetical protein [Candidatus Babeliales bacterium]